MRVFCCSAIYSSHNLRMRQRSSHHFVKILENRDKNEENNSKGDVKRMRKIYPYSTVFFVLCNSIINSYDKYKTFFCCGFVSIVVNWVSFATIAKPRWTGILF